MNKRILVCTILALSFVNVVSASNTDGTIGTATTSRYAYMESGSWLDFGTMDGNVHVTDSALTGYVWSAEFGWISLNCSNDSSCSSGVDYKVVNDGDGVLSGYSWSETAGWIDWKPTYGGVTIGTSGIFSGRAWGDQVGWITFNCLDDTSCGTVDYKVSTDWRPINSRPSTITAAVSTAVGSFSSSGSRIWYQYILTPIQTVQNAVTNITSAILGRVVPNKPKIVAQIPVAEAVTQKAPLSMRGDWNLLPADNINQFALAPLPQSVLTLVQKFPDLAKTFKAIGISKMSDLNNLSSAKFVLSGIGKEAGIAGGVSVPIASLTDSQKKILPSDIVFAKASNLIDYSIFLSIGNDGTASQEINTIVGKPIELAIKADKPVTSIKGYLTVKNLERQSASRVVPATSLLAAPIMALLALGSTPSQPITGSDGVGVSGSDVPIEDKLVLQSFDYTDENHDGIYTASITAPMVHGEYEIISVMDYKDKSLSKKELRLTAVVDPEGYVYEPNGNKETRIPDAKVILLVKDAESGQFSVWPAKDYQQINPQKTDKSGTYSFLVPEGEYKLTVSAPGYYDYTGDTFTVQEGHNVHEDIAVKAKSWWRTLFGLH